MTYRLSLWGTCRAASGMFSIPDARDFTSELKRSCLFTCSPPGSPSGSVGLTDPVVLKCLTAILSSYSVTHFLLVFLIPPMKLYPSGFHLCKRVWADSGQNSVLLILAPAVSCTEGPAVGLARRMDATGHGKMKLPKIKICR